MPLQNFFLLQAFKLSAIFLLALLLLPCLIVALTFTFLSCFLLLPILCFSFSVFLFFWVAGWVSFGPIWNLFLRVCVWFLGAPKNEQKVLTMEDRQVSVDFDPSEFPYYDDSEEEDKLRDGREQSYWTSWSKNEMDIINDSWQFPLFRSFTTGEDKSFSEVLSFWKRKEKEVFRRLRLGR